MTTTGCAHSAFRLNPSASSLMLIFDQLKKDDPQLRAVALVVFGGLGAFAGGAVVGAGSSALDYQANLETQSFRTVRIPAVRGRILDRNALRWLRTARLIMSAFTSKSSADPSTRRICEGRPGPERLKEQHKQLSRKLKRRLTKEERNGSPSHQRENGSAAATGALCGGQ